jgi:hypothetical protein
LKAKEIPSVSSPNEGSRGSVINHTVALYCVVDDLLKAFGESFFVTTELFLLMM